MPLGWWLQPVYGDWIQDGRDSVQPPARCHWTPLHQLAARFRPPAVQRKPGQPLQVLLEKSQYAGIGLTSHPGWLASIGGQWEVVLMGDSCRIPLYASKRGDTEALLVDLRP